MRRARAKKRTIKTAAAKTLGAAGLGFSLVGSAAASAVPNTNVPQFDNNTHNQQFVLGEEEMAGHGLATFHLFDRETVGGGVQLARGCGGCGGCRGCGGGCGGFRGCGGAFVGGCRGCGCRGCGGCGFGVGLGLGLGGLLIGCAGCVACAGCAGCCASWGSGVCAVLRRKVHAPRDLPANGSAFAPSRTFQAQRRPELRRGQGERVLGVPNNWVPCYKHGITIITPVNGIRHRQRSRR